MEATHQIVGFHFRVTFEGVDVSFQSVSGLDVQIETESIKEGGENRFEHKVPVRRKYSTLTLKRGILKPSDSGLSSWLQKVFHNMEVDPMETLNVVLLNEDHEPLMEWQLSHVWPISWKIGELNAEKGEVLIETMELNYNYFNLKD